MSPKGIRHEVIKASLNKWWLQHMPSGFNLIPETTFRLDATNFIEPDFVFFSNATKLAELITANALLCVEVADTSLRNDTGRKAKIYAAHGICELWTINTETLQTHIFSKPSSEGYQERRLIEPDEMLAPDFALETAVKLSELPLL